MNGVSRSRPSHSCARLSALLLTAGYVVLASLCAPALVRAKQSGRARSISGLPTVRVPGGSYQALYADERNADAVTVPSFLLMTRPVTNVEFLAFVRSHPSFRRGRIAAVLADPGYLSRWAGPAELGSAARPAQPVTGVSWFAARAFCESHGLRLPLEREWELAASASETQRDGRSDPRFRQRLLDWYSTPSTELPDVPHLPANVYGIRDLHGVIWEWVLDFGDTLVGADGRNPNGAASSQLCGSGALLEGDGTDYAAFMRVAMRSSLEAHYTGSHLGFRCAGDLEPVQEKP